MIYELEIPMNLCPMSLSKNGRVHWRTRHEHFQYQKTYAVWIMPGLLPEKPWPAAIMDINWRYARGRAPDDDNAVARVAGVRDAFETAGIVKDDKDIRIGRIQFTKVKVGDECVIVTLKEAT